MNTKYLICLLKTKFNKKNLLNKIHFVRASSQRVIIHEIVGYCSIGEKYVVFL